MRLNPFKTFLCSLCLSLASLTPSALKSAVYPDLVSARPNPEPALPSQFDGFTPPVSATAPPAGAPVVAEWTRYGRPDDALTLTGKGMSAFTVFAQTTGYNGTLATSSVAYQDSLKSEIILPAGLPANSMVVVWPGNGAGTGAPVAVNKTELWWVGPDAASAGATVSAYG